MVDYKEEDSEIKEAYDEFQRIREHESGATVRNILTAIPRNVWISFAIGIAVLMYLTFVQKTLEESTFFWFIIGVLVLLLILGAQSELGKKTMLPEQQLKAILYTKLKEKQRISPSEVPNGDISVLLPCKLKKIEGKPIKFVMSFKITTPSGLEKYYTAELDPFDGYMMGFEERPAGFRGTEVTDVSFIRHREDVWADRYPDTRKGGGK